MRKVNSKLYITAGIITVAVFTMGVLLGLVIEGERITYMNEQNEIQKVNFDSIQLQYLYISNIHTNRSCNVLAGTLDRYIKQTDEIRARVERYSEKSNIKDQEFLLLKREYIISQINYWILAGKTKQLCGNDYITVLFFYDKDESDSRKQGFILDYFKKMFGDRILVFSLDSDFENEPMIDLLKETYNVEFEPVIIVEDDRFEGFQDKDALKEVFCNKYIEKPVECL